MHSSGGIGWRLRARIAAPVAVGAGAAALAVLLAGCAGAGAGAGGLEGTDAATTSASTFASDDPLLVGAPSTEVSDAVALVGSWQVMDAEGETAGTPVWVEGAGVTGQTITVFRECGPLFVEWAGTSAGIATGGIGGAQECFLGPNGDEPQPMPEIPWLTDAHGFRVTGESVELLDVGGGVLARLDPAMGEPVDASKWTIATPPVVDEATREALRVNAPLAPGLVAATAEDLVGTWTPVGIAEGVSPEMPSTYPATPPEGLAERPEGRPERATITFRDDGHFTVDECRTADPSPDAPPWDGHPWVGDGNGFWTASYSVNLVACWPSWPGWDARARTIALDNGYLRLFDLDGNELGRLERVG